MPGVQLGTVSVYILPIEVCSSVYQLKGSVQALRQGSNIRATQQRTRMATILVISIEYKDSQTQEAMVHVVPQNNNVR